MIRNSRGKPGPGAIAERTENENMECAGPSVPFLRCRFLLAAFLLLSGPPLWGSSGAPGESGGPLPGNGFFQSGKVGAETGVGPGGLSDAGKPFKAGQLPDFRNFAAGMQLRIRTNLPGVREHLSEDLSRIVSRISGGRIPDFNAVYNSVPPETFGPYGDSGSPAREPETVRSRRIRRISGWDSGDPD